jgi:periplasmic protein TonB
MFDTLVESGSHKDDVTRKGSFIVFLTVMVAGIWYADAKLDQLELELVTLVAPVPVQQVAPDQPKEAPKAAPTNTEQRVATRTEFISSALDPTKVPEKASATASKVPPVPPGGAVKGNVDYDPPGGGPAPIGTGTGTGTGGVGKVVSPIPDLADAPPPPPAPSPVKKTTISGGVLNGKAVSKPPLVYPAVAKAARVSGAVNVQVVVDETGKVVSATAVSGHPLLRQAAQQAAYGWRFSPTLLSGVPVKVTGTIVFNYTLQ